MKVKLQSLVLALLILVLSNTPLMAYAVPAAREIRRVATPFDLFFLLRLFQLSA